MPANPTPEQDLIAAYIAAVLYASENPPKHTIYRDLLACASYDPGLYKMPAGGGDK